MENMVNKEIEFELKSGVKVKGDVKFVGKDYYVVKSAKLGKSFTVDSKSLKTIHENFEDVNEGILDSLKMGINKAFISSVIPNSKLIEIKFENGETRIVDSKMAKNIVTFAQETKKTYNSPNELYTDMIKKYPDLRYVYPQLADVLVKNKTLRESSNTENISEAVLTLQQRRKRAMIMKKYKNKLAVARKRKSKRLAGRDQLMTRAKRAAIMIIRKKVAGNLGADYKNLSASQKMMIDKKVQARKNVIKKLAIRLFPKMRQMDIARFKARSASQNQANSESNK